MDQQLRVLVVDDDAQIRALIATALAARGYTVTQAGDGTAGLAAAMAWSPDLLVTDLDMPGLDGRDLAERLATHFQGLRVLFVSGREAGAQLENLPGRRRFLPKPFSVADLVRTVATLTSC